jgi:IclR family transcriptional regulator, pca regulon regulatory protein
MSAPPEEPAGWTSSFAYPGFSQALERGLAIFGCFTSQRPVLGVADVADELGMGRSTAHRYMATLVALGFLEQLASRKYRLGLRVADLGLSALNSTELREHTHPHLEELRQRTGHTVNVSVLDGTSIRYVDRARSFCGEQSNIDCGLGLGSQLPIYCTAMGKILLAYLPQIEQRERIAKIIKLEKCTPNTILSKSKLLRELKRVAEVGIATNDEEFAVGLRSIASPLRNESGDVVAAINMAVSVSTLSLEKLVDDFGPDLTSTALRISARLGYREGDNKLVEF